MYETPLPLIVRQIIAVGMTFVCSASATAFSMTVDYDGVPAERLVFFIKRRGIQHLAYVTVDLETVEVKEKREVIELVVRSEHSCFPDLTFFRFTVSRHAVNACGIALALQLLCDAAGSGNALTERTGGHIDSGNRFHIGVALKECAQFTERLHFGYVEKASHSKRGVKCGTAMTL